MIFRLEEPTKGCRSKSKLATVGRQVLSVFHILVPEVLVLHLPFLIVPEPLSRVPGFPVGGFVGLDGLVPL